MVSRPMVLGVLGDQFSGTHTQCLRYSSKYIKIRATRFIVPQSMDSRIAHADTRIKLVNPYMELRNVQPSLFREFFYP